MDTVHEEALAAAGTRADGTIDINAALRSLLEGLLDAMISGSGVANLLGIAILRRVRADVAIVAPAHAGMPLPSL